LENKARKARSLENKERHEKTLKNLFCGDKQRLGAQGAFASL